MFYKISVLKNFAKIYRKTPVLGSFFNKVVGLRSATLLKGHSSTGVFLLIPQNI